MSDINEKPPGAKAHHLPEGAQVSVAQPLEWARIIKASDGEQVLLYVEFNPEDDSTSVHQMTKTGLFHADAEMRFVPKEDGEEGARNAAYKYLQGAGLKQADTIRTMCKELAPDHD